jgi:hypothetical protein
VPKNVIAAVLLLVGAARPAPAQPPAGAPQARDAAPAAAPAFARLVEELSEPAGYFDTDNLISNEASYLHVVGKLRAMGVRGGAYIGVGPDQNFSYIAHVRPSIAFIIDVRRDNLLQHLVFKSLFSLARNRAEYLCLLTGRPVPRDVRRWDRLPVARLVAYVDSTPASAEAAAAARRRIVARARTFRVPLSPVDVETMERIHGAFVDAGLELRFTSAGRLPRPYYPTYRQLLVERDLSGRQASYLASEDDFQFLKRLQERDLVIPVVGNLAGEHALAAIGRLVARRGERVSALYTSNVEYYLMRDGEGAFDRFAETVKGLPRDDRSVIVRSYFGRWLAGEHPQSVPGYFSTQLLQTMASLVREHEGGGYQTYADLVRKHSLELR